MKRDEELEGVETAVYDCDLNILLNLIGAFLALFVLIVYVWVDTKAHARTIHTSRNDFIFKEKCAGNVYMIVFPSRL